MVACDGSVWAVFGAILNSKSVGKKHEFKMVVKTAGRVEGLAGLSMK